MVYLLNKLYKNLFTVGILTLVASAAIAATTNVTLSSSGNALPVTPNPLTLLSAVTTTGASTDNFCFIGSAPATYTCSIGITGTAPSSIVVSLEGSIDNTTWGSLATSGSIVTDTVFHVINKPVYCIRGNLVTRTTTSTDTAVTFKCIGRH